MLTLKTGEMLSEEFKVQIPTGEESFLVAFDLELYSLDYEPLVVLAQGLRTIVNHVHEVSND